MKEFIRRRTAALFDLRVIVGICGVLLSIAAHELFHIIIHWGEISSIHIFPDTHAIVEVLFTPSANYDLSVEEIFAYLVTMAALMLTTMLIGDITDARSEKTVEQTILANDFDSHHLEADTEKVFEQLAALLGVARVMHTSNTVRK